MTSSYDFFVSDKKKERIPDKQAVEAQLRRIEDEEKADNAGNLKQPI